MTVQVQEVGAWIFLGAGTLAFLRAIIQPFFKLPMTLWQSAWPWFFGTLAIGTSVWGLAFFEPYISFVKAMNIFENQDVESYSAFMDSVGQGDVEEEYAEVGMEFMLANPVEGMEEIVHSAVMTASDPAGRELLQQAQDTLQSRAKVADVLTRRNEPDLDIETVRRADEFTARSVGRSLHRLDAAELERRGFQPDRVAAEIQTLPPP